ncbi:MAG: hypothetical protein KDC73_00245 [Ignavibacteriae bacterium]|nr:hypothetical protein [Ignavibacteriota bacterium]MCB9242947.1 hypothetical protein [Ignavibacteriales bacterium]
MRDIKALTILKSFSNKERKDFASFLACHAFVSRTKPKQLYGILLQDYPDLNESDLDKVKLYKELFPVEYKSNGYNASSLRHCFHELQRAAEKFLVFMKIENDEVHYDEVLRREFRDRHLDKLYMKALDESDKKFAKVNELSSEYFLAKYKLILERINFESMYEDFTIRKSKTVGIDNIERAVKCLGYFFMMEMFYHEGACLMYSNRYGYKFEDSYVRKFCDKINFEDLFALLKAHVSNESESILFKIYVDIIELYKVKNPKRNKDKYIGIKKYLLKNIECVGTNERFEFFGKLIRYLQYCFDFEEIHNIFKIIIENGYYKHTEGTYFQADYYLLIISHAMTQDKLGWLEKFLVDFKPLLQPELQDVSFNFGMARLEFERGSYVKSLIYLNKINVDYFDYAFHIKVLYIKIFYEMNYLHEVLSLIASVNKYILDSKKVTNTNKAVIRRFMNFTKILVKIKETQSVEGLSDLKDKIKSVIVREKPWLLEKISELELKKRVKS